ncbi:MAG: DUF5063 domain-containing protein [Muribaculaceae bacterium]|nr:DUF5063 domain-containing protein [Muribaculaceae bacterium]
MDAFNDNQSDQLTPNALSFLALCNEYCEAIENIGDYEPQSFVDRMVRLLPRIYISAIDLKVDMFEGEGGYIAPALDEDAYNTARDSIASLLGEEDTFLEVFMQDMKYSDSPIAATISECLADLFQVYYDLLETCREAPVVIINDALAAVKESFVDFWSQTLTNVLRAINAIAFNGTLNSDFE